MEDSCTAAPPVSGTLEELAVAGQKHLEDTVNAANEVLASLDQVLCNPAVWSGPAPAPSDGAPPTAEPGWGSLEAARTQYKASTAALRGVVTAITTSSQGDLDSVVDAAELEQLEQRAEELKEEVFKKNRVLKHLIDRTRQLITDLSLWQTTVVVSNRL